MATQTSRLKLLEPDPTDNFSIQNHFNANMEKLEAEAVMRNKGKVWSDSTMTLSAFIADCESMMPDVGMYSLGYINWSVAQNYGLTINGYVVGFFNASGYKKIEIHSSANTADKMGSRATIAKTNGTWASAFVETPNDNDIFYRAGETINTNMFGYGYLTSSSTKLTCEFPLPKVIPSGVTPSLQTGSRFEMRGVNGYVGAFTSGNSVEVVGNSEYTVALTSVNGGRIVQIDITHNTAYTTPANNTPVMVRSTPLKIAFS